MFRIASVLLFAALAVTPVQAHTPPVADPLPEIECLHLQRLTNGLRVGLVSQSRMLPAYQELNAEERLNLLRTPQNLFAFIRRRGDDQLRERADWVQTLVHTRVNACTNPLAPHVDYHT